MATRTMQFVTRFDKQSPNQWSLLEGDFSTGFALENAKMGVRLDYGAVTNMDGKVLWCQPQIYSPGGAVVIPFIRINDDSGKLARIKIGVDLVSERPVADDIFVEVPRGFSDPTKTGFETPRRTAQREFGEADEAAVRLPENRFTYLGGPYNMDDTWFCHPEGMGVFIYSCEVFPHELALVDGKVTFKPGITTDKKFSKIEFVDAGFVKTECGMTQLSLEMLRNHLSR